MNYVFKVVDLLAPIVIIMVPVGTLVSGPEAGHVASPVLPSAYVVLLLSSSIHLLAGKCDFQIPSAPLL